MKSPSEGRLSPLQELRIARLRREFSLGAARGEVCAEAAALPVSAKKGYADSEQRVRDQAARQAVPEIPLLSECVRTCELSMGTLLSAAKENQPDTHRQSSSVGSSHRPSHADKKRAESALSDSGETHKPPPLRRSAKKISRRSSMSVQIREAGRAMWNRIADPRLPRRDRLLSMVGRTRNLAVLGAAAFAALVVYNAVVSLRSARAMSVDFTHGPGVGETLSLLDGGARPLDGDARPALKDAAAIVKEAPYRGGRRLGYETGGAKRQSLASDTDLPEGRESASPNGTPAVEFAAPGAVPVPERADPAGVMGAPVNAMPAATGSEAAPSATSPEPAPAQMPSRPEQPSPHGEPRTPQARWQQKPPIGPFVDGTAGAEGPPDGVRTSHAYVSRDPLQKLFIKAEITPADPPFRVLAVREQQYGFGALVSRKGEAPVWTASGHVFPNGWILVEVTASSAAFLSPGGKVIRVSAPRAHTAS